MKHRTMCSVISWVFWVFWVVICVQCASSIVPAPVNVSVVCNNFQTVVSWTYSQQLLDPLFCVYISSMATSQGRTTVRNTTRDLQYNLSDIVWSSLMRARDAYTVEVSAVSGGQESTRTTSPKFTFNKLHEGLVQILCTLDLPPVEVLVSGQVATVTFPNPMTSPELQWTTDIQTSDPLLLSFDVTEQNVTQRGKCSAQNKTCKLDFMLPSKKEKHCLSLNAGLQNSIHVMNFNHKAHICGQRKSMEEHYWLFLALLLALFVLVVCSVGFMVWKSKACFLKSPSLPRILDPKSWSNLQKNIMNPESERVGFFRANGQSSPSVVITQKPSDPAHTADGLTEASDQETLSVDLSGDSCPSALYCDKIDGSQDDPEEEDPEQEEEVECEPVLAYDRPHFLSIDMGDRDVVHTYGL